MMRAMADWTGEGRIVRVFRAAMFTDAGLLSDIGGDTAQTIIGSAGT
jgi:hypothetical protein